MWLFLNDFFLVWVFFFFLQVLHNVKLFCLKLKFSIKYDLMHIHRNTAKILPLKVQKLVSVFKVTSLYII